MRFLAGHVSHFSKQWSFDRCRRAGNLDAAHGHHIPYFEQPLFFFRPLVPLCPEHIRDMCCFRQPPFPIPRDRPARHEQLQMMVERPRLLFLSFSPSPSSVCPSLSLGLALSILLPPSLLSHSAFASPFSTPWRCLSPAVIYRKPAMTRLIVTTRRLHEYLLLSSRINETRSWPSSAVLTYTRCLQRRAHVAPSSPSPLIYLILIYRVARVRTHPIYIQSLVLSRGSHTFVRCK